MQADEVMAGERKEKMNKEYNLRARKVLETKLNSRNLFKAIKAWAISAVRSTACTIFEMVHNTTKGEGQENKKAADSA